MRKDRKDYPSCQISLPTVSCRKLQEPYIWRVWSAFPNASQLPTPYSGAHSLSFGKTVQRLLRQVGLRLQGLLISEIGIGHHYGVGAVHFLGSWGHGATSGQCRRKPLEWLPIFLAVGEADAWDITMRPPLWLRWSQECQQVLGWSSNMGTPWSATSW